MNADVVVVGSGAAGLTAAITAAKSGLKVIVLESTSYFGGTSALSGGGVWIPVNRHQRRVGIEDSREEATAYLRQTLNTFYDSAKIEAFLDNAPALLEFLEDNTEVQLVATTVPDVEAAKGGWKSGRCLLTAEYSGLKLGPWLKALRPPIPEMGLFESMQVGFAEAAMMANWSRSAAAFQLTVRRILGYALDRVKGRRGTILANGNALVGRLLRSALDAGVVLLNECRARALLTHSGAVTGVESDYRGTRESFTARLGVVIASGGFGANLEMRRKYLPQADSGWSLQPEGSQGDGIAMSLAIGATLNEANAANGIWVQASSLLRPDGTLAKFPSFFDRCRPGSIMVDARTGKRFVDEGLVYQHVGETTISRGITKMWQISDSAAVKKYGLGMIKPAPFRIRPWVKRGYVVEAKTIRELATYIDIDAKVLEKTVEDFNNHADEGTDPDFNRGGNYFSAFMGDPEHKPNPALGALRQPPFYALELRPSDLSTLAGLNTNEKAQVLDRAGRPIPNLYAAGLDNNTMTGGLYPSGGITIGAAMTFGFIAARCIANLSTQRDPAPVEPP